MWSRRVSGEGSWPPSAASTARCPDFQRFSGRETRSLPAISWRDRHGVGWRCTTSAITDTSAGPLSPRTSPAPSSPIASASRGERVPRRCCVRTCRGPGSLARGRGRGLRVRVVRREEDPTSSSGRRTCRARSLSVPRGPEDPRREHQEPDAGEEQRNAHHDREGGDALGEVGGVQGRRECGGRHPHVAKAVLDRLTGLRVLGGGRLVRRRLAVLVQEAAHLGVRLAAGWPRACACG